MKKILLFLILIFTSFITVNAQGDSFFEGEYIDNIYQQLLKLLNIQGSLVTIDAIGTAKSVMDTINKKEADYLLPVKKGNPLTYQETTEMFSELRKEKEFTIEEKKQLSEALQIQKICMGFAMLASEDAKKFRSNAC